MENDIKLNELLSNPIADKKEEIGKLHSLINSYNEKKDYSNKINGEENELKNKKSSLNNLIKENESKNKNYLISSKNFQNQINVNNIEIQNLKRA